MADEKGDPLAELERVKALAKAGPRIGQLVKAARKGDVMSVGAHVKYAEPNSRVSSAVSGAAEGCGDLLSSTCVLLCARPA